MSYTDRFGTNWTVKVERPEWKSGSMQTLFLHNRERVPNHHAYSIIPYNKPSLTLNSTAQELELPPHMLLNSFSNRIPAGSVVPLRINHGLIWMSILGLEKRCQVKRSHSSKFRPTGALQPKRAAIWGLQLHCLQLEMLRTRIQHGMN